MPVENRRIKKLLGELSKELDREFHAELAKRLAEARKAPLRKSPAKKTPGKRSST
jgi:hypothetical protein